MKHNKSVVIFLVKFFGTYLILFLLYSYYLNRFQQRGEVLACSPITESVANQTSFILNTLDYKAEIEQHPEEMSMLLKINDTYIARVVEGCNSISIIVLFIAFIVAFSSKFIITALYILFGSLVIYITNLLRISVISIAIYEFPTYENILHDYMFPAIIYGVTFLLWFIWVRKFSKK